MTETDIIVALPPVDHAVLIDHSLTSEGENTLTCTLCGAPIVLLWHDGEGYSLRESDANDPLMGAVKIDYVGGVPPGES